MILQVKHNPEFLEDGEMVAFVTGKNSINTSPKFLRIGKVTDAKKWIIEETSTGKLWKVYTQSVIKVGTGTPVRGVHAVLEFDDKV